jgi:hypothetical protein
MRKLTFLLLAAIAVSACNSSEKKADNSKDSINASEIKPGEWIVLLNGKSLDAWHTYGKGAVGKSWKLEDGVLHLMHLKKPTGKVLMAAIL